MKRTFIAVKTEPCDDLKNAISSLRSGLRDENIKWTDTGNLHVTLAFIGDTEKPMIKSIGSMLENEFKGSGIIDFTLTGFGLFRSITNPRIIFSVIENPGKLIKAHEDIKERLTALGLTLEEREFNPHLTIGRIKNLTEKNNLQKIVSTYAGMNLQEVSIYEIIYYESVLLPTGPIYKPILKVDLR